MSNLFEFAGSIAICASCVMPKECSSLLAPSAAFPRGPHCQLSASRRSTIAQLSRN